MKEPAVCLSPCAPDPDRGGDQLPGEDGRRAGEDHRERRLLLLQPPPPQDRTLPRWVPFPEDTGSNGPVLRPKPIVGRSQILCYNRLLGCLFLPVFDLHSVLLLISQTSSNLCVSGGLNFLLVLANHVPGGGTTC